ncbi:MAG: SDR family oxidoreductase [Bacteroidales bacterium]|jgi:gluconate 5-dehydrogenase|nr:SDR family oxidoreductase [Bacteroidales bacterium]
MNSDIFDVNRKNVLITGASQGLGLAFAEGFLKNGATVILNDVLKEQLEGTVKRFCNDGYNARGYCFDITDEKLVAASIGLIENEVGPIDILINNAGIQRRAALSDLSIGDWRAVIDVNLTSAFIVSQAVSKMMIKRNCGKIINITSINAELARQNIAAYCAAKGGLKMLTKSMATEWGQHNINVNAIGPGYILTDLTAPLSKDPAFDSWVKSEVPLQRWGETKDLVGCAIFLASSASDYLSGQTIYIDGGWQASL